MLAEDGGGEGVGFFYLPIAGLDGDDFHAGLFHGVFETSAALLAVESSGHAFDDGDGITGLEFFGEGKTDLLGSGAIVRADERGFQAGLGKGVGVGATMGTAEVIGKDLTADIMVAGLFIAATAAVINRIEDGWHISRVGGLARVKVNGVAVKAATKLNSLDVVTLGRLRMQFLVRT